MNISDLVALEPDELASMIFERRKLLADLLPEIESKMAEDADVLAPQVEKLRLARDAESNQVAELKRLVKHLVQKEDK